MVENAWPIPDDDPEARGAVVEGPVFARSLARWRALRYEVRRWPGGEIPDLRYAVGGPVRIDVAAATAAHLLELVPLTPRHTWGRDEIGAGEMWNSNSVISWLLARAGLHPERFAPPDGGRAPGWHAGILAGGG